MSRQFGKFQLLKKIATGGMAEIFIAKQRGMEGFEKIVVIKTILPALSTNEEFVQMFLDEARIAARLTHPNIVQIFDLGRVGGTFFIAMEYVQGENLRTIVKQCRKAKQPVPLEHTVKVISQACEGLHYAHTKTDTSGKPLQIVHRDVSPQNILISFEGVVKLVDFGIAKAAIQYQETRAGILKGKYSYMSPEQCLGEDMDNRSDIFSAGIVLWELATGVRLYKRSSELMILKDITEGKVPPPREVNRQVPAELEAIILRALARNPENRFQTALEMHMALEEFLKSQNLTSSTVHLAGFMKNLFQDKLDGLKKIDEAAQAAPGRNLESYLFDDISFEEEMYVPGGDATPGTEPTANISPTGSPPKPSPLAKVSTAPLPLELPVSPPLTAPLTRPPPPARRSYRGVMTGVLVVAILAVLSGIGYLVYSQMFAKPDLSLTPDAGPVVIATPEKGSIAVTSDPVGGEVYLDGNKRGVTPLRIADLEVGRAYTLEVAKPTFKRWTVPFKLDDGGERPFKAKLEPLATAPVEIITDPVGATVTLDGKSIDGTTPLTIPNVSAGIDHVVVASLAGRESWTKRFRVDPSQTTKLSGTLPRAGAVDPGRRLARFKLRSRPSGAAFMLDGAPVAEDTLTLEPGRSYTLTASLPGYRDWSQQLEPTSGQQKTITAKLKRGETAIVTSDRKATLSINSTPWAKVYLDGAEIGQTPLENVPLSSGSHTIKLVNEEIRASKTFKFTAGEGETVRKNLLFEKGYLQVRATPWAHVMVNDKKLGTTPFEAKELFEGTYAVTLENPALGRTMERKVTIRPGETTTITANFLQQ